jgi:aryl sulfotransferase
MPPRLLRPASREYRHWTVDSRRWEAYRPRADDIVISTYPKCGTTWSQRIVSMLVFRSPEPRPIHDVSLWPDMPVRGPVEAVVAAMEAQEHRRFIKAHLPLDGLPIYEGVKYIHVARDDRVGLADPAVGRPMPRVPADPRAFFPEWLSHGPGSPMLDFFGFEETWWDGRRLPDVLLVHYNDLKSDLAGEMRRIADFLGITIPGHLWPALVEAAGFEAMKRDGTRLLPTADRAFQGGAGRFLHKGTNERWRGVLTDGDLALYEAKVREAFTPGLAAWVEGGMRAAGDPRDAQD